MAFGFWSKQRPVWRVRPRLPSTALAAAVSALVAASCGASPTATDSQGVVVVDVIDGDTVTIRIGETTERVRLLGIDAPESVHPTVPEQCFGQEAAAALQQILPPGSAVDVYRDEQLRDHFGRLLLYVYRAEDGLDVNSYLVEVGMAAASFYEPNYQLRSDIQGAERRAKTGGAGLWGSCDGPDQPLQ